MASASAIGALVILFRIMMVVSISCVLLMLLVKKPGLYHGIFLCVSIYALLVCILCFFSLPSNDYLLKGLSVVLVIATAAAMVMNYILKKQLLLARCIVGGVIIIGMLILFVF